MTERIAIGADHAGVHLKDALGRHLADRGYEVIDLGTHGTDRVDYPDFGAAVGRAVAGGDGRQTQRKPMCPVEVSIVCA